MFDLPQRSIPACAGEPGIDEALMGNITVYPRVCGGTTQRLSSSIA